MKHRHTLNIVMLASVSIVLSLIVYFISGNPIDLFYILGHVLGYAGPPFIVAMAILFIGLILQLAKRPIWKPIYIIAWIAFGIIHIASLYGNLAVRRDY